VAFLLGPEAPHLLGPLEEFIEGSRCRKAPVGQHDDLIGPPECGPAVGNDQAGRQAGGGDSGSG
jgi:hypothetical protein